MADVVLASELEAGRYICLKTGSLFGALIRLMCGSPYDHVAVMVAPGEIVQATVRGVKRTPLSDFHGAMACVNSAEDMTAIQRDGVVKYALACDGFEYQWQLIFVLGLRKLGLTWPWLLKVAADKGAMICSELAAAAGMSAQPALTGWKCGYPSVMLVKPSDLAARRCTVPVVWD